MVSFVVGRAAAVGINSSTRRKNADAYSMTGVTVGDTGLKRSRW
jgi:hypothetical protein